MTSEKTGCFQRAHIVSGVESASGGCVGGFGYGAHLEARDHGEDPSRLAQNREDEITEDDLKEYDHPDQQRAAVAWGHHPQQGAK